MAGVPEAVFVEACIFRSLSLAAPFRLEIRRVVTIQLPLTCDAGSIPGGFHPVSDGALFRIHDAERTPVAEIVLPCHQLKPRRSAQGHRVGMGETRPRRR